MKRRTKDGRIIELCVLPDKGKPDGLKIAKNGDLYISALLAKGLDVVKPDGTYAGFIAVGRAPTNCAFVGSELYVTDGGHLGMSATPEMAGALWRVSLDDVAGLDLFQGHVGGREPLVRTSMRIDQNGHEQRILRAAIDPSVIRAALDNAIKWLEVALFLVEDKRDLPR